MSSQTPKKVKQPIFVSEDDSTSSTEDYNMDSQEMPPWDAAMEEMFRGEVRSWLALNAKILFGLESTKYLSRQSKLKKVG